VALAGAISRSSFPSAARLLQPLVLIGLILEKLETPLQGAQIALQVLVLRRSALRAS